MTGLNTDSGNRISAKIAGRVQDSIVDGPGLRYVVFFQGCLLNCVGCHNQATQPLTAGTSIFVDQLIEEMLSNPLTTGLTLSGGEPTLQAAVGVQLAQSAHAAGLSVWCYSGYRFEHLRLRCSKEPELETLLGLVDVLVDGPFILAKRSLKLKFRGSSNQRLINMPASLRTGKVILADV